LRAPFDRFGRNKAKYGNRPTSGCASKLEAAVHRILLDKEVLGLARDIKQQVQVHLTRAEILYKPDFSYFDNETNQTAFVEAKGFATAVWAIKKRLWKHYGPGRLEIYTGSYKYPKLTEIIIPRMEK
jgi:hypothetical protein